MTKSSTEAKLVAVDDAMTFVIWAKKFRMAGQGSERIIVNQKSGKICDSGTGQYKCYSIRTERSPIINETNETHQLQILLCYG